MPVILQLECAPDSPSGLVGLLGTSLTRSSGRRGLRICMSNLQSKFPGAAAGGDHTLRTLDVPVVTIQVLLMPSPGLGIVKGLSLLQFITAI